jgi:hypothetical protein
MRPPDSRRGRPDPRAASRKADARGNGTRANVPPAAGAARELAAWGAAVVHLHAAGLPAAVPEFPAAWLGRRGVRADWVSAA